MGVLLVACQGPTNSKITEPKLIEVLEKNRGKSADC